MLTYFISKISPFNNKTFKSILEENGLKEKTLNDPYLNFHHGPSDGGGRVPTLRTLITMKHDAVQASSPPTTLAQVRLRRRKEQPPVSGTAWGLSGSAESAEATAARVVSDDGRKTTRLQKLAAARAKAGKENGSSVDIERRRSYKHTSWNFHENSIQKVPPEIVKKLGNKYEFHKLMEKYNLLDHVPKTYRNISDLTDDKFDDNKLYFLKGPTGSCGKNVFPVKSRKDIDDTLVNKKREIFYLCNKKAKKFLVQEEVPNMYLQDNKFKFTVRNYVLLCDSGNYFYNDGSLIIHSMEYDKDNLNKDIHVNHSESKYEKFSDQTYYDQTLSEMISICSKLFTPYCEDLLEDETIKNFIPIKNRYIILGLDFIIDKDYKPYFIEINSSPMIDPEKPMTSPLIKADMFNDFIKFYVLPKLKNKKPENSEKNNWIKL